MAVVRDEYTLQEIAACIGQRNYTAGEDAAPKLRHYLFDTRNLISATGTVFLALPGQHRDGHSFAQQAYQAGIRNFILSQPLNFPGAHVLLVPNVLQALQALATVHRSQFKYPVVGITGSNGKTIVKEWLASLMPPNLPLSKSPRSYNSQLGVALSLLEMRSHHQLAIIEAGISQAGEMTQLAQLLRPTLGIFTHLGDAHAKGFSSLTHKLQEKLLLFTGTKVVVGPESLKALVAEVSTNVGKVYCSVGTGPAKQAYRLHDYNETSVGWQFTLQDAEGEANFILPHAGPAALQNATLAIAAARELGLPWADLPPRVATLSSISMRMELITDNPEVSILNDAYNADAASVRNAFSLLAAQHQQPRRRLILTDLEHQGAAGPAVQHELLTLAASQFGREAVVALGPLSATLAPPLGISAYPSTEAFLSQLDYAQYRHSTVLLKGARSFKLEHLIPYLSLHPGLTYLKINLNALAHNLHWLRSQLPAGVACMAMLKAGAYGGGSWQIAQELAREGVDMLAVAQPQEGIELRQRGIQLPIVVLAPDVRTLGQLWRYHLQPAVWSLALLQGLIQAAPQDAAPLPIHLELDTGMARLGLTADELPRVLQNLADSPALTVASVFTHLSAAEDPAEDAFTEAQVQQFLPLAAQVLQQYPQAKRHVLNTGGLLRHAHYALEMVRLGIGLYGVSPVGGRQGLQEVASLHTEVLQLHHYPRGASISYNRTEIVARDSRIATVPLGYADGFLRALGGRKSSLLIRGQRAPVLGRVCMDLLMLDVTDVPGAAVGDEVVAFGTQQDASQSITELALAAGTIPYELLAGLSSRIRRVYDKE